MPKKKEVELVEPMRWHFDGVKSLFKDGGFNPETKEIIPFKDYEGIYEPLEAMAQAVDAKVVDRNNWIKQFFANRELFDSFMEELNDYDDVSRIRDNWYFCLMAISGCINEEGFIRSDEIVNELLRQAEETNQI